MPVRGTVDDAAWLALVQLEHVSNHRRTLVVVGHLVDDAGRTRLLERAKHEHIAAAHLKSEIAKWDALEKKGAFK